MLFYHFLTIVLFLTLNHFSRAEFETNDLTSDEFQLDCLLIHNKLREKHCSQQIKFSNNLKTLATRRATFLAENDGRRYTRIPDSNFGENVYRYRYRENSRKVNCNAIVMKWYKEKRRYNWKSHNSVGLRTRRFAQIVWNSTQRIGCASVASLSSNVSKGHIFTVCNYFNLVKFPVNSSKNMVSIEKCDQILSRRRFRYKALTTGEWLQECINEHNRIRKQHSVGPLIINEKTFQSSQKRAIEMAEKGFRFFRHLRNLKYGENILWTKATNVSINCSTSIDKWYKERDNYDWDSRIEHNGTIRHFIQILWKSSKTIGCAQVQNVEEEKGGIYMVCMYEPKADYLDPDPQWENVFPDFSMIPTESPPELETPGPHDSDSVDELDEETELEKEFKDVDDIIDTRKGSERMTPAISLEDMYIKTTTESNGFDRSEYIHKSSLRRKNSF